jgi:hypothetical protein
MGGEATSKATHLLSAAADKRWGTRKIKSRAKTGQSLDELPEWYHRGRGEVSEGKYGCEQLAHPPAHPQHQPSPQEQRHGILSVNCRSVSSAASSV